MKKGKLLALICAAALVLSSCALFSREAAQPPEGAYALYFAALDSYAGPGAVEAEYRLPPEGKELPSALVEALLAGPESEKLTSPFPEGSSLRSWELEEEGGLHLDMNEPYGALSGIDLTIADYCLALTLCQLEGVEYVHITVMGEELPFWRADALRARDVLLSGAEEQPVVVGALLYYPESDGSGLGGEYRDVVVTESENLAGAVMRAYMDGPRYPNFRSALPGDVRLLGVSTENGICYIDLSGELLTAELPAGEAMLLVYSIVNTVGRLEKVEAVQLQVEGVTLEEYAGIPLVALKPDPGIET